MEGRALSRPIIFWDDTEVIPPSKTLAKNLRLVSLSFDPDYNTPQRLADYSEAIRDEKSTGCEWRFATAKSPDALAPILTAYDQTVDKRPDPNHPQGPLFHTLRVFLIDRQARVRNIYSSGTLDSRLVLADVKTLLVQEAHPHQQNRRSPENLRASRAREKFFPS